MNYFYQNRSGIDISEKFITSGDKGELAHNKNTGENTAYVLKQWPGWNFDSVEDMKSYTTSSMDVSGGWLSGFGYNKNMIAGGMALWTLQNMFEHSIKGETGGEKFEDGSGKTIMPESDNKYPDILDECRYELDFMSKMKVQADEKTWGDYAGMYYHEAVSVGITPDPLDYECDDPYGAYAVTPPTFAATLNYAACAAQGARLWAPYDKEYSDQLFESAKEAYAAYLKYYYAPAPSEDYKTDSLYAPKYSRVTNLDDADTDVTDDAYWAACELYITATERGDDSADEYYKQLSDYKDAFKISNRIFGGSNDSNGSFTVFNYGNTAAAGSLSLALHEDLIAADKDRTSLSNSIVEAASKILDAESDQGYSLPYLYDGDHYIDLSGLPVIVYDGFETNSNVRVLNNMFALAYAYDITGDDDYLNGVTKGMDYLMGNNPLSFSYITGYGSYHAENPSHRFWQKQIKPTLPAAPDGVLTIGPSVHIYDNYMLTLGFLPGEHNDATERYYVDAVEAWSTNETTITGNASLAWIVSFIQDSVDTPPADTGVEADVNSDGKFTIADVVLLQKWLLAEKKIKLSNWKAADLCKDEVLDVFDLIQMKKALIAKK